MMRLIGISGSLRKGSFNTALLRTAQELMPAGATLEIATIDGIPLYDGDLEAEQGIPPAVASQIFTPFYTTSEHGTGLGLYIAQQLCEANQCTLSYQPVPGGGSCFRIVLPPGMNLVQDHEAETPGSRLNLA